MRGSVLFLLCLTTSAAGGKDWALLFTGAMGWFNYSTHANLCHAYHVLHNAGIPEERIVVIMYGDVANNRMNPYPGKLFNNYTRIDVKRGTPMDYTGDEITSELILAVLSGDKATVQRKLGRAGKVIESGQDDNIFVAVSDHGGIGTLLMPNGNLMFASDIINTLNKMNKDKKYAKLVWYLESCHSASIFSRLSKDINIYALTASDAKHDAFMDYCFDPDIKPCLGGQFSSGWMESAEKVNLSSYTLKQHANAIKKAVNQSHPQLLGDLSITKLPLQDFFGGESLFSKTWIGTQTQRFSTAKDTVPFHKMPRFMLMKELKKATEHSDLRKELKSKISHIDFLMEQVDAFFYNVAKDREGAISKEQFQAVMASPAATVDDWDCYESALRTMIRTCPGLLRHHEVEGYAMSKFSVLVNMCNKAGPNVAKKVEEAALFSKICY